MAVLSKIKVGETIYDLKDASARADLSTMLGGKAVKALGTAAWVDTVTTITEDGAKIPVESAVHAAIQTAVAGFALAYVDKIYPEGTPLTWSDDGKLTKCSVLKRVLHPERVIATFYKEEKQESWHGVKVNNRHWVKVR